MSKIIFLLAAMALFISFGEVRAREPLSGPIASASSAPIRVNVGKSVAIIQNWWCVSTTNPSIRVAGTFKLSAVTGQSADIIAYWSPSSQYVTTQGADFELNISTKNTSTPGTYTLNYSAICDTNEAGRKYYTKTLVVAPTVSGANEMWYFNGSSPAGFTTSQLLKSLPSGSTLQHSWSVINPAPYRTPSAIYSDTKTGLNTAIAVSKSNAAILFPNKSTSYVNSVDSVTVQTGGASVTSSTPIGSQVYLTINGVQSDPYNIKVRTPEYNEARAVEDIRNPEGFIYLSFVNYRIYDQFNNEVFGSAPINEHFTSDAVYDYPGGNGWGPLKANGNLPAVVQNLTYWNDQIGVKSGGTATPQPIPLQSPPSSIKSIHFSGEWRVGDSAESKGTLIQRNSWQLFIDHGRHFNIVSPVPANTGNPPSQ